MFVIRYNERSEYYLSCEGSYFMALRENYRELLLEAAVLVVSRDGLDHATTKAIAKEAACNEVYIYRNFGSKEGLLQAAFDRADIHISSRW